MNLTSKTPSRRSGFTLVEMIGVLAVIAILSGLLIPRVFSAISQSRINTAALGANSLKTGAAMYLGKNSSFGAANPNFGALLVSGGYVEAPYSAPIATSTSVAAVAASPASTPVSATTGGTYDLLGTTGTNMITGNIVVEAVLTGVALTDARELNDRIDGIALGTPATTDDVKGRVKFAATDPTTVYIYVANQ